MTLSHPTARWPAAVATFVVWMAAVASVVFWGLRLSAPADAPPPPVVAGAPIVLADPTTLGALLGAVPAQAVVVAAPEAASRFTLLGVAADAMQRGFALIAVDGKPARPFRIGGQLAEGYVLQSVGMRTASIGGGLGAAPAFTLQLPVTPMAIPAPPAPR
jgi:general secretion pathway protein C